MDDHGQEHELENRRRRPTTPTKPQAVSGHVQPRAAGPERDRRVLRRSSPPTSTTSRRKGRDFTKNINYKGKHLQASSTTSSTSKIEAGKWSCTWKPIRSPFSWKRQPVMQAIQKRRSMNSTCPRKSTSWSWTRRGSNRSWSTSFPMPLNTATMPDALVKSGDSSTRSSSAWSMTGGDKPEDYAEALPRLPAGAEREEPERGDRAGAGDHQKLIELHGGQIAVESEWGKGTTIRFRIPMIVAGGVVESADRSCAWWRNSR